MPIDLDLPKADADLIRSEEPDVVRYAAVGDWRIEGIGRLSRSVDRANATAARRAIIDLSRVGHLDTAGAWLLHRLGERLAADGATIVAGTLVSERVSFSRIIASQPALTWLDNLGRLRAQAPPTTP